MKKLLISSSIAALLLPALASAAYNDVTLSTDVVLSVNGITLNVFTDTATIESIEVGATTFTATLQANSSFLVSAPDLNVLSTNQQLGISVDACSGMASKLGYIATSTEIVVTVTPSASLCATSSPDDSGGTGGSSGGGGGSSSGSAPVTPIAPTVNTTQLSTQEAIAAIKVQLVSLIQQLIVLLNQELQKMQTTGT